MTFLQKIKTVYLDKTLRRKIGFVLIGLIFFRILAAVPIPGVDAGALDTFFANNQFFGLLNIFSGSGLSTLSIVMLGVGPYITASIIMQLLTMMIPKLKAIYHEEGQAGRAKFAQFSRRLSVPLAAIQAFAFLVLLTKQGIISSLTGFETLVNIIVIVAGSTLLMWLGELITEYGVGNGVSLIIFAGIVSSLPTSVSQLLTFNFTAQDIPLYLGFVVAALIIIWAVVFITEAERPIPITYAKRIRGQKVYGGVSTYLPLRVNQAGVIPIIFALSILLFPQMILSFLAEINNSIVQSVSNFFLTILSNGWIYAAIYFALVFLFTYFYTAVTFDPDTISTNLQKSGAFIPGIRPGQSTSEYLSKVLTRITLVGATFLSLIAVLPLAMKAITNNAALSIGGTALLIVVAVVLDLIKKIDAQVSLKEY